jgi:hypothetical protein
MSKDILNYTLAGSAAVLTFFMAWILYYVVSMIRDVRTVMRDIARAVEKLNSVLDFTKEKVASAASLIPLVIKGVEKGMEFMKSRREQKQKKQQKRSHKDSDSDL